MGILIGVFSVAVFTDWRFYRIPNLSIVIGITAGLYITYMSYSASGILESLVSMFFTFMAFYPFYLIGGIGAGDVKLFMMVCCYIRGNRLLYYMLVTMLLAAIMSGVKMIVFAESRERLFYLARYLRKAVLTGAIDEYRIDKTQKKCVIRLSIPASISLLFMFIGIF